MSAHTPGPWQRIGCAIAADELDVARIYMPRGMSDDTCRANASLIAASPALLTAAIEAKSAMDGIWNTAGQDDDWIYDEMGSDLSAGYFSLRAAIAKATGA